MNKERCRKALYSNDAWSRMHFCNKPAKGNLKDGTPACGIHLAAEKKRLEREEKNEDERRISKEIEARVTKLVEKSGIRVAFWSMMKGRPVSMSVDGFEKLIERSLEGFRAGYESGHNDTVEGMYCDPGDSADAWLEELVEDQKVVD